MSRRHADDHVDRDPAVEAELAALEAVLAGEPPTGTLEVELAGLVREVREEAPSMPLALRERLDRDVTEGFLGNRGNVRKPRLLLGRVTLGRVLPALAGLAAVLVAVVVARGPIVDGISGGGETISRMDKDMAISAPSGAGSSSAAESAAPEAATKSDSAASPVPAAPVPGREAAPGGVRKVERAVDLRLRVGLGKLQDAADGVVRATQGVGGYVQDSQVSARGRSGDAAFTLRVPTARLDEAIATLSKLGHVSSLNQSSQDISSSFVSVGEKLSDARAERRALLRALSRAQRSGEIASLRERIRGNRADLAALKGQLDRLRARADMATIEMGVTARREAGGAAPTGGWTPGDAAGDALRVLEVVAGVVIVAATVLVPLGLVVLLAVFAGRAMRRRRRERALDGA